MPLPLEPLLHGWRESWEATRAFGVPDLGVDGPAGRAALTDLVKRFRVHEVYPDLSGEMIRTMRERSLAGEESGAMDLGAAVVTLYPRLQNPSEFHGEYGMVLVAAGKLVDGARNLRSAHDRNANGLTGVARTVRRAQDYEERGAAGVALAILEVVTPLHPRSATLRFESGEMLLRQADTTAAVRMYAEALALNAAFPHADWARERLRRLTPRRESDQ